MIIKEYKKKGILKGYFNSIKETNKGTKTVAFKNNKIGEDLVRWTMKDTIHKLQMSEMIVGQSLERR